MTSSLRPAVILDRDGTLLDVVRDEETGVVSVAFHPDHVRFLPGVVEGLAALARHGFSLAIATNQPGPAKGQFSRAAVERTNAALVESLARTGITIDAIEVCFHHPEGGPGGAAELIRDCDCRKPKPGLLLSLLATLNLDPAQSFMVGDSPSDVLAARAAGIGAALVFPKHRCELCPLRSGPSVAPDIFAERFDLVAERLVAARGSSPQAPH